MGERFLKHPPKSQIERVFGGSNNFNSVYASTVQYLWVKRRPNLAPILLDQFYWTNSTGPILLDQFGTNSTEPILLTLLAYDFFLNF